MSGSGSTARKMMAALWFILAGSSAYLLLFLLIRAPQVNKWDRAFLILLDPLRTEPLIDFFRLITRLASAQFLYPLIIISSIFLLVKKEALQALILSVSYPIEQQLNHFLKIQVMRQRPDLVHLTPISGYSFPSGHAMNAAIVYGLLLLFFLPYLRQKWQKTFFIVFGVLIILLVGFSRLFLRVHYPTDVLAGFAAGAVIVGLARIITILANIFLIGKNN